ncbi:MAG: hypothetical protein KIT14_22125 [bacterium]|nr:hypothetical protein [bacterium]
MSAAVLVAAVLSAGRAAAAEFPVRGAKLVVSDPTGDPARRKVVVTAKDGPGSAAYAGGDPTTAGATLRMVFTGGTPSDLALALDAAGWRPSGGGGFRYAARGAGGSSVAAALSRSAKGVVKLKVQLKGVDGVVPPAPGDTADVVLSVGGGHAWCVGFGGAAGGTETRDDARAWLVRKPGVPTCPPPPTTTSTSTTSTTSSTGTTATTTTSTTVTTISATSTTSTSSTTTTTTTTQPPVTTTTTTVPPPTTTTTTTAPPVTTTTTTTTTTTAPPASTTTTTTIPPPTLIEVNLLYVHGLKSCAGARTSAHDTLAALDAAVAAALPARIAAWEAAHPGKQLVVRSARANVYTATASGIHPSDSPNPLDMDDWEVGDPGCTATAQGQPCTTAYEWRYRLAKEIERLYPAPAKNVVLVGHSAGGRAAMEVAANVGPGGVGTMDWGVQQRIAGVVSVQGMIDQLGTSKYNVVGITSFETACKNGDAILGFGESCAPGNGFCEWAARVSGFPAADWVAQNRRARMLISWGSCSPSAWTGRSDGTLPYDAQGSTFAVGLDMTPAPGQTWRPAHGESYGSFCHSAVTNASNGSHVAARTAARDRILEFLFTAAPRVAAQGSDTTGSIAHNQSTGTFPMGASCPSGDVDDTVTSGTKGPGIDVVGVCRHPGFFDGDDHAVALAELTVANGATCNGTYRWTQAHDASNNHAAQFWWKTRSLRANGPDLVSTLPAS